MPNSRKHLLKGLALGTGVPRSNDPRREAATKGQDCIDPELSANYYTPMFCSLESYSLKSLPPKVNSQQ